MHGDYETIFVFLFARKSGFWEERNNKLLESNSGEGEMQFQSHCFARNRRCSSSHSFNKPGSILCIYLLSLLTIHLAQAPNPLLCLSLMLLESSVCLHAKIFIRKLFFPVRFPSTLSAMQGAKVCFSTGNWLHTFQDEGSKWSLQNILKNYPSYVVSLLLKNSYCSSNSSKKKGIILKYCKIILHSIIISLLFMLPFIPTLLSAHSEPLCVFAQAFFSARFSKEY